MSEIKGRMITVGNQTYKVGSTSPEWMLEKYFNNWLAVTEANIKKAEEDFGKADSIMTSLYEVMKDAIDLKQYVSPINEFEDVERIIKVRVRLPRTEIEKLLGFKTYSIYGVGLYVKMEGLVLSPRTRNDINYDNSLTRRKNQYLNCDVIPEDVLKDHDFSLAVPATGNGLFVPKKSRLTEWLRGTSDLQYFDLMQFSN